MLNLFLLKTKDLLANSIGWLIVESSPAVKINMYNLLKVYDYKAKCLSEIAFKNGL